MPLAAHGLRALVLVALAAAVVVALAVVLSLGSIRTHTTEASTTGPGTMGFRVTSGSDCLQTSKPLKCTVPNGGTFHLAVAVNDFPTGGYVSIGTDIDWTGGSLLYTKRSNAVEVPWPDRGNIVTINDMVSATRVRHGDLSTGAGSTPSTFKGNVVELEFTCPSPFPPSSSSNVITLVPHDAAINPNGSSIVDVNANVIATSDSITINCQSVHPNTQTPVATATSTVTPTATPNPVPRVQKLPPLQNLWLTRQGTKIPPIRCLDSTDVATLTESISVPVSGFDPKDPSQPRQLGGFAFQVTYNPLKVCVDLTPGPAWTAHPAQICTVEDSVSAPTLQGVARMNCVTLGKATLVDTSTAAGRVLATIAVRPQPEAYSQIRASQDNGQVVQLNNGACKLTDLQGHAIEVFSCEDADVTIRFLEGDVEPDCAVNTIDTQAIAFRWGAGSGSLIYNSRFDVSGGGGISVNDLQFVYGRFGSTCAVPWPAQVPVKAK